MKVFFQLLLVLVFAAATLARPSNSTTVYFDYVGNTTSSATRPGFDPSIKVYSYNDLMNGPEPIDQYPDLSVLTTASVGAEVPFTIDLRMSGDATRQHVGQLSGQRMWDAVYRCLVDICPHGRGQIGCWDQMPGAGKPQNDGKPNPGPYYSECWISDVPYKNEKGDYVGHGRLTIKAQAIFRDEKNLGLGAATHEMAAGVYKQATENMANCYLQGFNFDSRTYQFCNVPKNVLVALPTTGPVTESWLSMTIEFDQKQAYNLFDCSGTKSGVIGFWEIAVRPKVANILGFPENQWATRAACENDEGCFSVDGWRNCKWGV